MKTNTTHNDDFLSDFSKKNKNPFKIPENYFDTVSKEIDVNIKTIPFPKESGFIAPNNYFNSFKVQKPKNKIIQLLPYISTIAAVFVLGLFVFKNNQHSSESPNREEIINYLSSGDRIEINELMDNTSINTDHLLYSSIDDVNISIDQLALELSESDIIEF